MSNSNQPFQTRDNQGGLEYWDTLSEAMAFADENPDVWKVSFAIGDERVRLVKYQLLNLDTNTKKDHWVYEPLLSTG